MTKVYQKRHYKSTILILQEIKTYYHYEEQLASAVFKFIC